MSGQAITIHTPLDRGRLLDLTRSWFDIWCVDKDETIDVKLNRRLTRSLGICRPGNSLIGLNQILLDPANSKLLDETLCHELAHLITHRRFGRDARPHGHEWASLMYNAGFNARVRIPSTEIAGYRIDLRTRRRTLRTRYEYEHYCPACDAVMTARRTNYRWRCAPCLNAGRSGELTVTRRRLTGLV